VQHIDLCGQLCAFRAAGVAIVMAMAGFAVAQDDTHVYAGPETSWREAGRLEQFTSYENPTGKVGVLLASGPVEIRNHPFFRPMGSTGRSCASCHDPQDGMAVSTAGLQERWRKYGTTDAVFAAIDGANCPDQPPLEAASHSLLLERGLFRIPFDWPPRDSAGRTIAPEFSIEVMRDPTGCNTDSVYGINGSKHTISVYRRPRITANIKYLEFLPAGQQFLFNVKTAGAYPRDLVATGSYTLNLMSDARVVTLQQQHEDAIRSHMPGAKKLSASDMRLLLDFVRQVYVAQVEDKAGGNLIEDGGPAGLGPFNLAKAEVGLVGEFSNTPVFQLFDKWRPDSGKPVLTERDAFRASVARGQDLFIMRTFFVRDVAHINSIGLGNPVKRGCAVCHNVQMTGHDIAPGSADIGTSNWPWSAGNTALPLFKLVCRKDVVAHPYLGREIYSNDPGRALVTGKCADIGAVNIQQLRGLAARAPYFHDGSARTLREVIDFYDRRFNIGYTDQEKQDLINFLSVL
jgi:hypothetical protein